VNDFSKVRISQCYFFEMLFTPQSGFFWKAIPEFKLPHNGSICHTNLGAVFAEKNATIAVCEMPVRMLTLQISKETSQCT